MLAAEIRLSECWRRCVRNPASAVAWEDLLRLHRPLLAGIAYRVACRWGAPRREDVDELVQEICIKLSTQASRGSTSEMDDSSLEAYLKALAANTASDVQRSRNAQRRDGGRQIEIDHAILRLRNDLGQERIEADVLWEQLNRLLAVDASQQEQTIFHLYYRQGFTAKEIADIPGIDLRVKGVESQLARTAEFIRKKLSAKPEGFSAGDTF